MKILIVDDSKISQKMLSEKVKDLGYSDIIFANDGLQGLSACEAENPDLILSDIEMPNMDGIEMLGAIMKIKASQKIVMISSLVKKSVTEKLIQTGAFDVIKKPVTKDMLQTLFASLNRS